MLEDPYKYQINTLISAISLNMTPEIVKDILKFNAFSEMFSYSRELKKFRPIFKIQSFVEAQNMSTKLIKRKKMVIRDYF